MRYLRMFTNALAGGVLTALYLGVLVLQLNPQVPVVSMTALGWFGALLAMYGPYVTVLLLLAILGREAIASRPLHPGWLSVRILAWLSAALFGDRRRAHLDQPAKHAVRADGRRGRSHAAGRDGHDRVRARALPSSSSCAIRSAGAGIVRQRSSCWCR